ncbi:MAG: hypothetical protein IPP71_04785 [Bacteroidetes bacterium]|nr:hypothetical protein [Bacteroidota bacterium]
MNEHYFIKCTNCNHLNSFKTEFVTFCDQCGKKLKNNFQEWIKNNPGKTIKDFKKEICVTDNGHSAVKIPLKRNRYRIFVPLLIGVLVLFLVWINFAPIDLKAIYLPSKTPTAILKDNWNRSTYGKYGIAISAPEKLVKIEPNYPDELKPYIVEMESFNYRPSKKFTVAINNTFFKEQVRLSL